MFKFDSGSNANKKIILHVRGFDEHTVYHIIHHIKKKYLLNLIFHRYKIHCS